MEYLNKFLANTPRSTFEVKPYLQIQRNLNGCVAHSAKFDATTTGDTVHVWRHKTGVS
jgi:hypothetical protein